MSAMSGPQTPAPAPENRAASEPVRWKCGELILDAEPSVHVLYSQWKGRRCDFCFESCGRLRRCSGCKYMHYCSKECQQNDWSPCHRVECKSKLPAALADLSKCVDALGRPRWKSAQIQLAFRLLIRWRLDPKKAWPSHFLSSTLTANGGIHNYPQNTFPPSFLMDGGVTNGSPSACGAVIQTASVWTRLVANRYTASLFGAPGGGAFHRAVILLDRHVIRVTESSLVVRSLLAEHLVLGEAFYAPLLGVKHSCQPTAGFTFEGTRMQVRCLRDQLFPCELSINYMDIVGAVHTLCLPADIRRPQLSLRGIRCTCALCARSDCLLDGPIGSLFSALTRTGAHLFKYVRAQRSALEQLFRQAHLFCSSHHPTLTLMRLRLIYFDLLSGHYLEAQKELDLLLQEAAITHSGDQFDRIRSALIDLRQALQSNNQPEIKYAMEQVFDVKQFIPN